MCTVNVKSSSVKVFHVFVCYRVVRVVDFNLFPAMFSQRFSEFT